MWDVWFHGQIVYSKIEHLSNIDEINFPRHGFLSKSKNLRNWDCISKTYLEGENTPSERLSQTCVCTCLPNCHISLGHKCIFETWNSGLIWTNSFQIRCPLLRTMCQLQNLQTVNYLPIFGGICYGMAQIGPNNFWRIISTTIFIFERQLGLLENLCTNGDFRKNC